MKVRVVCLTTLPLLFVSYIYALINFRKYKERGCKAQRIRWGHVAPWVVSECGKLVRQKPQPSAPYMFLIYGSLGFLPYHPYHFYLSLILYFN